MDSARTSLRLGAENVYLIYRRAREQMPAREEEIENAFEEGVQPRLLTNPIRILGNERGWVKGIECLEMELGEPDESGRRRPIPKKGSEHVIDVDMVIMAIGQGPNPLLTSTTPDLALTKYGQHRRRRGHGQDLEKRRLCRRRYRHGRGHGHPGHGRGQEGGPGDRRLPEGWAVVTPTPLSARAAARAAVRRAG